MSNIRLAREDDFNAILDIYSQALKKGQSTFNSICPSIQEYKDNHLLNYTYVYTIEDSVVGFITLSNISSRECYQGVCEISLYIHKSFTSKGIGSLLLKHLMSVCKDSEIYSLYVNIFSINTASISLFTKFNFREIGYHERIAKDIFGQWQNTTLMEYRL